MFNIIDIVFKGPKTIVAVDHFDVIGLGVSKCMKQDKYSPKIGFEIALARAKLNALETVAHSVKEDEQTWINRSVTQEQYDSKRR